MKSETLTEPDLLVSHKPTVLPAGTAAPDFTLKSAPKTMAEKDRKSTRLNSSH